MFSLRKHGIKLSAGRRWGGKKLETQQSLVSATATHRKVGGGRKEGDETTASFPFSVPSRRLTKNMLNYCFLPTCLVPSRTRAHSNNIHSLGKCTPNGSSYKLTKSVCFFYLEGIAIIFLYLFFQTCWWTFSFQGSKSGCHAGVNLHNFCSRQWYCLHLHQSVIRQFWMIKSTVLFTAFSNSVLS